jgi:hypothetical protein
MIDSAIAPPPPSEAGVKWAATAGDISIPTTPRQRGEMPPQARRRVEACQPVGEVPNGDKGAARLRAGMHPAMHGGGCNGLMDSTDRSLIAIEIVTSIHEHARAGNGTGPSAEKAHPEKSDTE